MKKTAFNLNLTCMAFFAANGVLLHEGFFTVTFVLAMLLPACSRTN